jgi:hypothetical protein
MSSRAQFDAYLDCQYIKIKHLSTTGNRCQKNQSPKAPLKVNPRKNPGLDREEREEDSNSKGIFVGQGVDEDIF